MVSIPLGPRLDVATRRAAATVVRPRRPRPRRVSGRVVEGGGARLVTPAARGMIHSSRRTRPIVERRVACRARVSFSRAVRRERAVDVRDRKTRRGATARRGEARPLRGEARLRDSGRCWRRVAGRLSRSMTGQLSRSRRGPTSPPRPRRGSAAGPSRRRRGREAGSGAESGSARIRHGRPSPPRPRPAVGPVPTGPRRPRDLAVADPGTGGGGATK